MSKNISPICSSCGGAGTRVDKQPREVMTGFGKTEIKIETIYKPCSSCGGSGRR